jgi:phytoene dehydrogenase-like protein
MLSGLIQQYGNNLVKGGMRNLPLALAGYLEAHGGEIRTDARVDRILVEDGRAAALRLADGDVIDVGQLVASSIDPQQLAL